MAPHSDFLLSKWYLDCVENDGSAFIGYAARLSWKSFSLNYASTLRHNGESQPSVETSLRKSALPQMQDGSVTWSSSHLKVRGTWKALCAPVVRVLFESSEGSIKWYCLQPRAAADLRVGDCNIKGLGYVDRLDASVKPWLLPLDTLRWGRYLSDSHSVIWIDWKGPLQQSFLFYDGIQADNCVITDDELTFNEGRNRLTLSEHMILRKGPLLSTSLSMIPGIKKIFPSRILQMHECKWRSKASFQSAGTPPEQGWAIHEIVSLV